VNNVTSDIKELGAFVLDKICSNVECTLVMVKSEGMYRFLVLVRKKESESLKFTSGTPNSN